MQCRANMVNGYGNYTFITQAKETDLCLDSRCYCVDVIAYIWRMNQPCNLTNSAFRKSQQPSTATFWQSHGHLFSVDPGVRLSETCRNLHRTLPSSSLANHVDLNYVPISHFSKFVEKAFVTKKAST